MIAGMIYGFLKGLRAEVEKAPQTEYRRGYLDALREIVEFVENEFDVEES